MPDHLALLPLLIPLAGAPVALLLPLGGRARGAWALGTMLTAWAASAWLAWVVFVQGAPDANPIVWAAGGWRPPFGVVLVADPLAVFMVLMTQTVVVAGVLYALGARDQAITYRAFYPALLTLAAGLTGAFLTGDLFNLFVFSELLVISGAVLTAVSDDRFGPEAAFKYFYMSLLAGTSLLLAAGGLYISYGTLNMADLAARLAVDPDPVLVPVAIGFLTATFMAKSAVFPFHFWQPDFHTASPTPVSALLSSVVVKLGLYGFLRMTTLLFVEQAAALRALLVVLGIVGVLYGGLAAAGTHNAKRMLAYSTLAQIGFMLVGVGWGTPLALAAALVFAFNHSLIKAALLMLAGAVASRTAVKSAAFSAVTGVGRGMPAAGALFFVGALALAGIPPTNGFISKLLLFQGGLAAERYASLAAIGLASILTLVYSMRAFMRIWWQEPEPEAKLKPAGDRLLAPLLLIVLAVTLGLWAEPLVRLATETAAWLGTPQAYIEAVLGP